jgi:hypothetical protein
MQLVREAERKERAVASFRRVIAVAPFSDVPWAKAYYGQANPHDRGAPTLGRPQRRQIVPRRDPV